MVTTRTSVNPMPSIDAELAVLKRLYISNLMLIMPLKTSFFKSRVRGELQALHAREAQESCSLVLY